MCRTRRHPYIHYSSSVSYSPCCPRSSHNTKDRDQQGLARRNSMYRRHGHGSLFRLPALFGDGLPGALHHRTRTWASRRSRRSLSAARCFKRAAAPLYLSPVHSVPGQTGHNKTLTRNHCVLDCLFCIHTHVIYIYLILFHS